MKKKQILPRFLRFRAQQIRQELHIRLKKSFDQTGAAKLEKRINLCKDGAIFKVLIVKIKTFI